MFRKITAAIDWILSKKSKTYENRILVLVIISFILSRLLYFLGGIRFNAETFNMPQLLAPELLKNNLLQSIYYLHIQPPLFNLFLGSILKLFPDGNILAFHSIYLILGLMLVISIFLIMTRLGVSGKLSAILTILFIVSPSCILFENILYYPYPVATFLCLSALFLHKFLCGARLRDGTLFFTLLTIIVLTRSLFNILWFILFVFILLFYLRHFWRKIILISLIPFLFIILLYAKNSCLYGSFSSSTWLGMSFCKITTFMLSEDERILLMKKGKISELSLIKPIKGLWFYRDHVNIPEYQKTKIPVLDPESYMPSGNNLNNIAYISISKQYLKDAVYVLKSHPEVYIKGLASSFRCYLFPSSDWFIMSHDNRKKTLNIEKFYNTVFYGQIFNLNNPILIRDYSDKKYMNNFFNIGFFLLSGFVIAVSYGIHLILHTLKKKPINIPFVLTILFLVINVVYVTFVSNLLEVGENQRFRFNIDPFLLILFGLFINVVLKKCKHISYLSSKRNMESENLNFKF